MSDVLNHRIRVRTGSRTSPPPVWCLTVFHLRSLLLRPSSEAPPPDLRYAGSSQTYLEPGFAESATVPVAL
jgi:hypothetical protein